MRIGDELIKRGTNKVVDLSIARLPSGTEIDMPVHVYRSEADGPVLLLTGGLHGDEVNGIEIIRRAMERGLFNKLIAGSVVAIPVLNVYGFLNYSRAVPDGKDVNRSFPGTAKGSLASRVAHTITNKILPAIDIGVDFHTGGASRSNAPQLRYSFGDTDAAELANVFHAPFTLNSKRIPKSLRNQAWRMKKTLIVYEGGETLRFDEEAIELGIQGISRLLKHLKMIKGKPKLLKKPTIMLPESHWLRASKSGLFTACVSQGSTIKAKQPLGTISDPYNSYRQKVIAKKAGHVIGINNQPVVNQGDALFHIGVEGGE